MVKENGMIMMSEQEYREMKMRISELEFDLDIAKMELYTYRSSIKKLANDNLSSGNVKEKSYGIEIPAGDFSDLIDAATLNWMEDSNGNMDEEKLEKLEETDLWFVWNGFCARIPYGCEICNEVLPAIKEAYDEYNS